MKDLDDLDYKDINDFDLSGNGIDENLFDDVSDYEVFQKKLTKEEEENFKDKVKEYLKDSIEEKISEFKEAEQYGEKVSIEDFLQEIIDKFYDDDAFDKEIFEKFDGQRELFFKFANEIIKEKTNEINEAIKKENEQKFYEGVIKRKGFDQREMVEYIEENAFDLCPEIMNENFFLKIVDADFVEEYFIEEGSDDTRKFISTEALELIDPELIKKDNDLREIISGCFIAPSEYIYELDDRLADVRYSDEYTVYEQFGNKDLSKYYEDFYNKFSGSEWAEHMMPSRLFKSEGKTIDSLINHKDYPPSFIIEKLVELDSFNRIEDCMTLDEIIIEDTTDWIHAIDEAGKEYVIKGKMRDKAGECLIKLVDAVKDEYDLDILFSGDVDFLVESYIRNNIEIPEEVKEKTTMERIERLKKEIELERLQDEDQKCDETLEMVEKLEKAEKDDKETEVQEQ